MLGALTQQGEQYRVGRYLGQKDNFNSATAPFFTYEQISEKTRRYDQIIQNLQTSQNSTVIRTNYAYRWKPQDKVVLQDLKEYLIIQVQDQEENINPQSASVLITPCEKMYYLELVQEIEDDQ